MPIVALLAVMVALTGVAAATNVDWKENGTNTIKPIFFMKNNSQLALDMIVGNIRGIDLLHTANASLGFFACTNDQGQLAVNCAPSDLLLTLRLDQFIVTDVPTTIVPNESSVHMHAPIIRKPGTLYSFQGQVTGFADPDVPAQVSLTVGLLGANITGKKCNDLNGDGICGQGEPGLEGWTIILRDENGTEVNRTTTDASGNYAFRGPFVEGQFLGLRGTFTVEEVLQEGWTQTGPPVPPGTYSVTIDAEDATDLNFANQFNLSISGRKFNDLNNNSAEDAGEPGLGGWQIDLNFTNGTIFRTTTTASDGTYKFENVPPGTYIVQEVQQPQNGWIQTFPTPVPPGTYDITLINESITGLDFGNFKPQAPGKVVGWGTIGPRASPEKTFKIFAYTLFMPKGTVEVHDNVENLDIVATQIDSVLTDMKSTPMTGTITGKATVNGAGPYDFTVQVIDAADPGAGADMFTIDVSSPTPYHNSGTLSMGDVNVVK